MKSHRPINNAQLPPAKYVMNHAYEVLSEADVDDERWYVIQAEPKVARWVREQSWDLWYEHRIGNFKVLDTFDINEKIYTMLVLKW